MKWTNGEDPIPSTQWGSFYKKTISPISISPFLSHRCYRQIDFNEYDELRSIIGGPYIKDVIQFQLDT